MKKLLGWSACGMAVGAAVAAGIAVLFMGGCYPRPPVNPPSCAQDPTQEWCLPPAFARAPDAGADGRTR